MRAADISMAPCGRASRATAAPRQPRQPRNRSGTMRAAPRQPRKKKNSSDEDDGLTVTPMSAAKVTARRPPQTPPAMKEKKNTKKETTEKETTNAPSRGDSPSSQGKKSRSTATTLARENLSPVTPRTPPPPRQRRCANKCATPADSKLVIAGENSSPVVIPSTPPPVLPRPKLPLKIRRKRKPKNVGIVEIADSSDNKDNGEKLDANPCLEHEQSGPTNIGSHEDPCSHDPIIPPTTTRPNRKGPRASPSKPRAMKTTTKTTMPKPPRAEAPKRERKARTPSASSRAKTRKANAERANAMGLQEYDDFVVNSGLCADPEHLADYYRGSDNWDSLDPRWYGVRCERNADGDSPSSKVYQIIKKALASDVRIPASKPAVKTFTKFFQCIRDQVPPSPQ